MKSGGISEFSPGVPSGILQSPVLSASFKVVQVRVENHTAIDLLVRGSKTPRLDRDLIKIYQDISRYKIIDEYGTS